MTTSAVRILLFMTGLILGLLLWHTCSAGTILTQFSPDFLEQQVDMCGARDDWMARDYPYIFWHPEANNVQGCYNEDIGKYCYEDGCGKMSFRFRHMNGQAKIIITLNAKQHGINEITEHQQWIIETYCVAPGGVDVPGAYGGNLVPEEQPPFRQYSTAVFDMPYWGEVYGSHEMDYNPYSDPHEADRWGCQVIVGILTNYAMLLPVGDPLRVAAEEWIWLHEWYIECALDRECVPVWSNERIDALNWIKENIWRYDPDLIIGRVGVGVEAATWGSIKKTYGE